MIPASRRNNHLYAIDYVGAGFIVLSDILREDSADIIKSLRFFNVNSISLTGDNRYAATFIAEQAGIDNVHSECLPIDKMGADGATFVQRDGEFCYYADESAIKPLWKGSRFLLTECISGCLHLYLHDVRNINDIT